MRLLINILWNVFWGALLWRIYQSFNHIPRHSSIYIFPEQDLVLNDVGINCLQRNYAKGALSKPVVLCADLNSISFPKEKRSKEFIIVKVSKRDLKKIIIYANFFAKMEFHTVSLDKPDGNRSFLANQFAGVPSTDIIEYCIFNKI